MSSKRFVHKQLKEVLGGGEEIASRMESQKGNKLDSIKSDKNKSHNKKQSVQ